MEKPASAFDTGFDRRFGRSERGLKGRAGFISVGGMGDFVKIGNDLREARRAKAVDLTEASSELCIRTSYLEAIEDGELEALPGRAYVIGFIRSYAEFLELDSSAILDELRSIPKVSGPAPCRVQIPEPVHESRIPAMGVLAAAGLGILFLALNWPGPDKALDASAITTPEVPARLWDLVSGDEADGGLAPIRLQGQLEIRFARPTRVQISPSPDGPFEEQLLMPEQEFLVDLSDGTRIAFQDMTGVRFILDGRELALEDLAGLMVPFVSEPGHGNAGSQRDAAT